jgi:hypothetical protein
MRNRSLAGPVRHEAFMVRAQDFGRFNIIRGKYDYASSPQLIEGVRKGDWAVVVQLSRVPLLLRRMVWLWSQDGGVIPMIAMV